MKLHTLNNIVCCTLGISDGNNALLKLLGNIFLFVPFQFIVSSWLSSKIINQQ